LNQHQPLSRYGSARFALAEARRVDEVKDVRDRAMALAEYARQAKDTELLQHATEIRLRAERRAGELLAAAPKALGGAEPGVGRAGRNAVADGDRIVPPALAELGVTKTQSSKWQGLAALPADKFEIRVEHAKARVEGMTTSAPSYSKVEYTGETEWFTPPAWIELARQVLGEIDLDPASHVLAQERVQAKTFFTIADNGLERPWFGRVWLNPPYHRALLAPFVDKAVAECANGNVSQAILLTHNYTDTEWFHTAARAAQTICFPRGRIHFLAPSGDECSPTQGQTFFYFGADDRPFRRVFSNIGLVVRLA
jgi:ParB family chromosome partitioning protein